MFKKGKEKVQERPSKKRSKIWDSFTEEQQPDGSKKAKCNSCGELLSGDSKNGTSHLWRHHKSVDCSEPPNKDARTTLPSYSSGSRENQLGYVQQTNTETSGCQDNNLGENHLGYVQQINTEPSGNRENQLEYDPQKNRELFVRMVIDNKSMLEHVENPFLEEFARFLQPSYSHVTRRDVEEDCLTFYKNKKAQLKEKITKLTSKVNFSVASFYNPKGNRLLCVAAHFIDNDYRLVKRIIGFVEFDDPFFNNDAQVGFYDERILNDWGLGKKAFACTVEKYYVKSANISSQTLVVTCILECFRSIADIIYQIIGSDSCSIERIMKDLNEFPEKMCYFNLIAGEHNLAPKFEFLLNTKGVLGNDLNILNDACTYKNVLCAFDNRNVGWSKVEQVVHLLNPINDLVVKLSSLEFPTSNLLLKYVFEISDVLLSEDSAVLSGYTKDAIDSLLDNYLASCDKRVLIASLLDRSSI